MDEEAVGAITAVWHEDTDTAELWFKLLHTAYLDFADESGAVSEVPSWSDYQDSLKDAAGEDFHSDTVDEFIAYLDENATSEMGVVRQLGDPSNLTEIMDKYKAALAGDEDDDEDGDEDDGEGAEEMPELVDADEDDEVLEVVAVEADTVEFDQDKWFAYLKEWDRGWDGEKGTWAGFVSGFLHYAPDGSRSVASDFIDQMEALEIPERIESLAEYGIKLKTDEVVEEQVQEPEVAEELPVLTFDPAELMAELIDEAALTEAVESGALRFEEIDDDELELESVA